MSCRGRSLSYEAVRDALMRRAAALHKLGLKPGDGVGLHLGDGLAGVLYHLAAQAGGLKPVFFDPNGAAEDLADRLRAAGVRVIVTSDAAASYTKATQLLAFSILDRVVVVPLASQMSTLSAMGLRLTGRDRIARVAATPSGPVVREADLLRDAGAMAAEDAAAATSGDGRAINVQQVLAALPELTSGAERILAAVPLSDPLALGLVSGIGAARAAEIVIPDSLEVGDIARGMVRHRASVLVTSPVRLGQLLGVAGRGQMWADLKATVALGGEATAQVMAAYAGVTKAPLRVIFSAAGMAAGVGEAKQGASVEGYRPLTETRFVVKDLAERGRVLPDGERGALYAAGPQFDASGGEAGAFVPTGDVGLIDAAGQVVVIDRIDELVVAAGYLIYPRRIEAALREHPGVTTAAVVGMSEGKCGSAPKAFVTLKPGIAVTEHDLMKHLGERISKIELPAGIDFCSSLPRDAFGEVDRRALREGAGKSE